MLFAGEVDFLKGVVAMDGMPAGDRIEVCFAGRSNVGKSSLINAIANRRNLARTSNTPGRTQELNFFVVGDGAFYFVDMPGYGFARAPKSRVEAWTEMVRDYLRGRSTLRRVYLLIDSRHGLKDIDKEIMALLDEAAVPYQVVLTKIDKIKAGALERVLADVEKAILTHPAAFPLVLATSAEKRLRLGAPKASIVAAVYG